MDFGAYFPYMEQDMLDLDVSLSTEPMERGEILNLRESCVLNHRYPNGGYITLSQKFGRKVCKTGVLAQQPHEKFAGFKYLNITYGVGNNQPVRMCVPIAINTTDEQPCAGLEIHLMLDPPIEPVLTIRTHKKNSDYGWEVADYSTKESDDTRYRHTLLTPANSYEDMRESGFILYNKTIHLIAQTTNDILV